MTGIDEDNSLEIALAWYFECLDRGDAVDESTILARFPGCQAELQRFFANERHINGKFQQLAKTANANHLSARCPNCECLTRVAVDSTLTDIQCTTCGSRFSLIDQPTVTNGSPPRLVFGRFHLIERLGMGAFGSVWKAHDAALDRLVAVKIPRHAGMTAEEQEKFLREARAAGQLRHSNIVSVHEVGPRWRQCVHRQRSRAWRHAGCLA